MPLVPEPTRYKCNEDNTITGVFRPDIVYDEETQEISEILDVGTMSICINDDVQQRVMIEKASAIACLEEIYPDYTFSLAE